MAWYHLVANGMGPRLSPQCILLTVNRQLVPYTVFPPSHNYMYAIAPRPEKMRMEEADLQDVCKLNSCIIKFELKKSLV